MSADYTLQLLVQLGVIGADDLKAVNDLAKQTGPAFEQSMGVVRASQEDVNRALGEGTEKLAEGAREGEKFKLDKRELSEILRQLGPQFGEIGELGRLAFNPLTLSVGGLLLGLEGIHKISALVQADLTGIQTPDIDLEKVSAIAGAWHGVADAVKAANDEFASAQAMHDRRVTQLQTELKATTDLIKAEEQRALAKLESDRQSGAISEKMFQARKEDIEATAAGREAGAANKAKQEEMAAKYAEMANAKATAEQKQQAAEAIHLPESDVQAEAQIEALKKVKAAQEAEVEKRKKNLEFVGDVATQGPGIQSMDAYADRAKFRATYGGVNANIADATKLETDAKLAAEEQARATQDNIDREQKKLDDRKKLREEAAAAARKAQELENELPADRANYDTERAGEVAVRAQKAGSREETADKGSSTNLDQARAAHQQAAGVIKELSELAVQMAATHSAALPRVMAALADLKKTDDKFSHDISTLFSQQANAGSRSNNQ